MQVNCHGVGFSKEIENVPRKLSYEGPSRAMRGCRCRQGIGFSTEIETIMQSISRVSGNGVARGLASRQRLKHLDSAVHLCGARQCRQGIGFSTEIETSAGHGRATDEDGRQGIGFSTEIETMSALAMRLEAVHSRQGIGFSTEIETHLQSAHDEHYSKSPGDWLLDRD